MNLENKLEDFDREKEILKKIREKIAEKIEETFTHPEFALMPYHDTTIPEKVRRGEKIPKFASPFGEDILAQVLANELRMPVSEEEYEKLKSIFIEY